MERKLLAAILTFVFTVTLFAQDATALTATGIVSGPAPEMCEIEETWTASATAPLVILLQEAHLNIQSQKNIIAALEYFQSDPMNIALEGHAPGEIKPILFREFPDAKITREVSDTFMREGKIDGAEFYAINSNKNARLFGIDDPTIYQKNIETYRRFRKDQAICLEGLGKIQKELNILKDKVFSKPLRDLRESSKLVEKNPSNLVLHLAKLEKLAKLKQIDLGDFPDVLKSKENIARLKAGLFFDQLHELEMTLSHSLARSNDEETLITADRFVALLSKLASLSLSYKEYQELRLSLVWNDKKVDDLLERQKRPVRVSSQMKNLLTRLEPAFLYYECARQRDLAMANNIEALTHKPGQNVLFVVAGGFHTRGLTELFREKKISYLTLIPKPGLNEDSSRYWNLLASTVKPRTNPNSPEVPRALVQMTSPSDRKNVITQYVRSLKKHNDPEVREGLKALASIQASSLGAEHLPMVIQQYAQALQKERGQNGNQAVIDGKLQLLMALQGYVESQFAMIKIDLNTHGYFHFQFGNNFYHISLQQKSPGMQPGLVITPQQRFSDPEHDTIATNRKGPSPSRNTEPKKFTDVFARKLEETGKYKNVTYLAKGGMAYVFRARLVTGEDERVVVAVKTLQEEQLNDHEGKKRFRNEGRVLSKIKNKPSFLKTHTVEIYENGEVEIEGLGGVPFYSMEFLNPAISLEDLLNESPEGRVPSLTAAKLIHRIALALSEFHHDGFTHRDIKPANIGLRRVGKEAAQTLRPIEISAGKIQGDFIPILMDLGLAKDTRFTQKSMSMAGLTQEGTTMGTIVFMSPEQGNDSRNVDGRTDVYALAVSLFQLITGQYPVYPENKKFDTVGFLTLLLDDTKREQALERSLKYIDDLVLSPKQKERLRKIFRKSIGAKLSERYKDAKEFAAALESFIKNQTREELMMPSPELSGSLSASRSVSQDRSFHGRGSDEISAYAPPRTRSSKKWPAIFLSALAAIPVTLGIIFWKKPGDSQPAKTQVEVRDPVTERLPVPLNVSPPQTSVVTLPAPSVPVEEIITLSGNTSSEKIDDGIRRMTQKLSGNTPDYAGAVKVFGKIMDLHEFLTASQREVLTRLTNQIFDNLFADQNKPGVLIDDLIDKMRIFHSNAGERGHFFRAIAHRFEFPGPNRDFAKARELFSGSALLLAESYRQTNNLRDLIFKGVSETKSGQFEESNRTLTTVKQLIQPGQGSFDTGILDVLAAQNYFGLRQYRAARDYFGSINSATQTFVFKPEFQTRVEDNVKLNFNQIVLNSYILDLTARYAEYRTLHRSGANQNRLSQIREEIRILIEESKKYIDPLEREMLAIMQATSSTAPLEELKRFHVAYTNTFDIALFYEAQASDPANPEAVRQAFEAADRRYRALASINVPRGVADPVEPFAWSVRLMLENNPNLRDIVIPPPGKLGEVTAAGLKHLAKIAKERRMLIRGEIAPGQRSLTSEKLQETLYLLLSEDPNTTLARLWGEEILATGNSLGNSKNIFNSVRDERILSPVVMEFDSQVLGELTRTARKLSDPRQGNPSAPLILLVPSEKEIRAEARSLGGTKRLWDEHRIGLVEWKTDLSKTKRASLLKNLIGRIKARYIGEQNLELDQIGFLDESFHEDWGSGILRIKFNRSRFTKDTNYRAASLGSAFYALNHKSEWKDLFDFNSGDNTYSLTAKILRDLTRAWTTLRSFLVSA